MNTMYKKIAKCALHVAIGIGAYYAGKMSVRYNLFGTENTVQIRHEEKKNQKSDDHRNIENLIDNSNQETFG